MIVPEPNAFERLAALLRGTAKGRKETRLIRRWDFLFADVSAGRGNYGFGLAPVAVRIIRDAKYLLPISGLPGDLQERASRVISLAETHSHNAVQGVPYSYDLTCGDFIKAIGGRDAIAVIDECARLLSFGEPSLTEAQLSRLLGLARDLRDAVAEADTLDLGFRIRIVRLADAVLLLSETYRAGGMNDVVDTWDQVVGFMVQHPTRVPGSAHPVRQKIAQVAAILLTVTGVVAAAPQIEEGVEWWVGMLEPPTSSAPLAPGPSGADREDPL